MLTHHQKYVSTDEDNLGYKERLEHLERIREGATCYMVMCRVRDQDRSPRQIASFNSEQLFVGGSLIERDGETFIEVIEKRPVADVIA